MPKKGRRKIIVGSQTYYYMVKRRELSWMIGGGLGAHVAIQSPDNKYYSETVPVGSVGVTPKLIENMINKHLR